jgi:hypothetical protein
LKFAFVNTYNDRWVSAAPKYARAFSDLVEILQFDIGSRLVRVPRALVRAILEDVIDLPFFFSSSCTGKK